MGRDGMRLALVMGANKGIGLEIARQLGRAGVAVLLGARDGNRGRAAAERLRDEGLEVRPLPLDVTEAGSVRDAAAKVEADHGRLDILVNNAGIGDPADGAPGAAAVEAVRRVFETNLLGVLAVTQAMLPLLCRPEAGRIVNLSSSLGSIARSGDPASPYYAARLAGYGASKAALNMLTVQLAAELRDEGIAVNAVCPGYTRTDLNGNSGVLSTVEEAAVPVRLALRRGDGPTGRFLHADGEIPW